MGLCNIRVEFIKQNLPPSSNGQFQLPAALKASSVPNPFIQMIRRADTFIPFTKKGGATEALILVKKPSTTLDYPVKLESWRRIYAIVP